METMFFFKLTVNYLLAFTYLNFVYKHLCSYPEDGFLLIRNMSKFKNIVVFIKIVSNLVR